MVIVAKHSIAKKVVRDLPIIYQDEDIIAIDKPSGLLSVASDKEKGKTAYRLVSTYLASFNKKDRPYLVHRLDEDTSGVLIFAKNRKTQTALQNSWQDIVTKRGYYAIVEGEMEKEADTFKDYLTQNQFNLVFVTKNRSIGKLATTSYKVVTYKKPYSLLDINISSGRKNQIRVQLGYRGHYVVGDDKYGEPSNPIGRLGLHAYQLTFTNPLNGKKYDLVSPMPSVFKTLMFSKGEAKINSNKEKLKKDSHETRAEIKIKKGRKRAESRNWKRK